MPPRQGPAAKLQTAIPSLDERGHAVPRQRLPGPSRARRIRSSAPSTRRCGSSRVIRRPRPRTSTRRRVRRSRRGEPGARGRPALATRVNGDAALGRSGGGGEGDLVKRDWGPKGWEPLSYLCFTRLAAAGGHGQRGRDRSRAARSRGESQRVFHGGRQPVHAARRRDRRRRGGSAGASSAGRARQAAARARRRAVQTGRSSTTSTSTARSCGSSS